MPPVPERRIVRPWFYLPGIGGFSLILFVQTVLRIGFCPTSLVGHWIKAQSKVDCASGGRESGMRQPPVCWTERRIVRPGDTDLSPGMKM